MELWAVLDTWGVTGVTSVAPSCNDPPLCSCREGQNKFPATSLCSGLCREQRQEKRSRLPDLIRDVGKNFSFHCRTVMFCLCKRPWLSGEDLHGLYKP